MIEVDSLVTYKNFFLKEIFEGKKYHWEVLNDLPQFIQKILSNIDESLIRGDVEDENSINKKNKIILGKNSFIERGAYVKGPAIIGDNVKIYHGSYIRENVVIGNDCIVGNCSEIKHSILLNGASAPHYNFVGNSILGENVNLGGGVHLSNFKNVPYGGEVMIKTSVGHSISTQSNYLGSIIGDESKIGVNCVLNPGTVIGKNVNTYPSITIRGVVEEGSLIKSSNKILNAN